MRVARLIKNTIIIDHFFPSKENNVVEVFYISFLEHPVWAEEGAVFVCALSVPCIHASIPPLKFDTFAAAAMSSVGECPSGAGHCYLHHTISLSIMICH